ncbi:NAD-dependent epimerase/dehydratase family protein [Patescibacteria group bacterium]
MTKDENSESSISYKPTALVAGGAGFIGSFLCQSLLLQGCRVIALDNLISGQKENLKSCLDSADFLFLERDLVSSLKSIRGIDYIFHLAGMEGNRNISLKYLLSNSQGTKNLLELAQNEKAKFLLLSSLGFFDTKKLPYGKNQVWSPRSSSNPHHEAKRFAEEICLLYNQEGLDARVVRTGWVYGPRMNLESGRPLANVFKSSLEGKAIELPGNGDQLIWPVFISDVIYGLTKAMFSAQTSGKTFNLMGSDKVSYFDLAQKIKKVTQIDLGIKFVSQREQEPIMDFAKLSTKKTLGWEPKVSLKEGLVRTKDFFRTSFLKKGDKGVKEPAEKKQLRKRRSRLIKRKGWFFKILFFLGSILIMTIVPFLFPLFDFFSGTLKFRKAISAFKEGRPVACQEVATSSWSSYQRGVRTFGQIKRLLPFWSLNKRGDDLVTMALIGSRAARTVYLGCEAMTKIDALSKTVFKKHEVDLVSLSSESQILLETIWRELSFLEIELAENKDLLLGNKLLKKSLKDFEQQSSLLKFKNALLDGASILRAFPDVVGAQEKKTYLLLLQNNMELRPTGGFIGSFVLVEFDKGRLATFEVYDVYTADGQLKGHVEPPGPIKEFLGEAGWYLRDSNWDPNFPTSAIRAQWFLEKSLGISVDGVFGANLDFVEKVIEAVGEIEVVDYREKITANNLFSKAEKYSESDFFPGSSAKKDFLGSLARSLLIKVESASLGEQAKIAQAIYQGLQEKDLIFFFNDPNLMKTVTDLGWEGSLRKLNCLRSEELCLQDYLMIVESNLGVNKANYYLKRTIDFQVNVALGGEFSNQLRINYLNGSPEGVRFGGDYKNYLRIYVPLGSKLEEVKVNGQLRAKVDLGVANGKTYFGFLVEVPIEQKATIQVNYRPPLKLLKGKESDYLLFWQKQSGADPSQVSCQINLPKGSSLLKVSPAPERINQGVLFKESLNKDFLIQTRVKL